MAINRAPYDALVDDNGTGLTGTIWNKAAIKNVILDPVDAALVGSATGTATTVINSTATGVQNAFAPTLTGDTVIGWTGGADLTINGMNGGLQGRRVTIRNQGSGNIYIAYNSTSAAGGTRFLQPVTSGPTPIASGGWATWIFDNVNANHWTLVAHDQGGWIAPPFNAALFATNAGAFWTVAAGDVLSNLFRVTGRSLHWVIGVNGTLSLSVIEMILVLPLGVVSASSNYSLAPVVITEGGASAIGECYSVWGSTVVNLRRLASATLTAGPVSCHLNLSFPIQ